MPRPGSYLVSAIVEFINKINKLYILTFCVIFDKTQSVIGVSYRGKIMNSIAKIIWPTSIVILLALLALKSGSSTIDNPLSVDPVEKWFSVTKR